MENIELVLDLLEDPETDVELLKVAIEESYQEGLFSEDEINLLIESELLEDYIVRKADKHDNYADKDEIDSHFMRRKFNRDLFHTVHHANSPDHMDVVDKKATVRDNVAYLKKRAANIAKTHELRKFKAQRDELVGKNLAIKAAGKLRKHIHNYFANEYTRKHDLLNASVKGGE